MRILGIVEPGSRLQRMENGYIKTMKLRETDFE